MFCQNCGHKVDDTAVFCENCGTKIERPEEEIKEEVIEVSEKDVNVMDSLTTKVKGAGGKKNFKLPIIIVVAIALIAGIVFVIKDFNSDGKADGALLYTADGEFHFYKKHMEYSVELDDSNAGVYTVIRKADGSGVFYVTNNYDLFYADYAQAEKNENYEPVKIASNVQDSAITLGDDQYLLFRKNGSDLYVYDGENDQKIKSNVSSYHYGDGKVLLVDNDQNLYLYDLKDLNSKTLVDEDIYNVSYVKDGLAEFYYAKGRDTVPEESKGHIDIYKGTADGKSEKVVDSASSYIVADNGDVYYAQKEQGQKVSLIDFVEDPYAAEDANVKEPDIDDYKIPTPAGGFGGYVQYIDRDAYDRDYDEYYEAIEREEIRRELRDNYYQTESRTLYCYTNGKTNKIAENVSSFSNADYGISFRAESGGNVTVEKLVHIDDIYWASDVYAYIDSANGSGVGKYYICADGKTAKEIENTADDNLFNEIYISEDGEMLAVAYENGYSYLYKASTKGDTVKAERVTENVSVFGSLSDEHILLYDADNYMSTTLYEYVNGEIKRIADDVYMSSVRKLDGGKVLFLADYSSNSYMGTLCVYENDEVCKVSDDVKANAYDVQQGLLYYIEYDSQYDDYGDLYYFIEDEEPVLVDNNVSKIWYGRY